MASIGRHRSLSYLLDALRARSTQRGVPAEVSLYAAEAARRAFDCRGFDPGIEARATRYYEAVVRRRLVTTHGRSHAATRLVLDSVVADLAHAGRDDAAIFDEIERGWSQAVPPALLAEYRARLCA